MCGINGFLSQDAEALRRMHAVTVPRGPDDEGFFETPEISLAHNRLSIIDLSPGGHQPMGSRDGRYEIVFNGEIYNFRELRGELEARGVRFRSQSDTEVLLEAFAAWGPDCLPKLNGMFAFAIWDRERRELFLARDPFGIKPLYHAVVKGVFVFSSEMKALLAYGHPREIDGDALKLYFRFLYVPGPRTMITGIFKLQPGHWLRVRQGQAPRIQRWWKPREGEMIKDYSTARDRVRETLTSAVRRQLVSDRPLGVFLSGGIDSSIITGLVASMSSGPVKTFTIGYQATEEAEKYNADARLAERTAKHFGTEHFQMEISGKRVAEIFEKMVGAMDEPVSNHVQPSAYFLAQFAKPQITVALGGDGADELLGGYARYWLSDRIDRLRRIPSALRPDWLLRAVGQNALAQKLATAPGVERHLAFLGEKGGDAEIARETFAPYYAEPWRDAVNQFMAADAQTWLPDESLIRSDRLTMAHALEQRVPFLDAEFAELAFRIPSRFKLDRRDLGKKILRDAFADLLPAHVANEPKRGFFSPAAKWLRGDLLPLARELLSDGYAPGSDAYLDLSAARNRLEDHIAKRGYHLNAVWAAMTFQAWWKHNL